MKTPTGWILAMASLCAVQAALAVRPGQPSSTAEAVCSYRGIAAQHPDPKLRNPDNLAEKLCGRMGIFPEDYAGARRVIDTNGVIFAAYFMINVRTHYIDAALKRAVADGATQVVVLGAGYDSRAYRFREAWPQVNFFEVDLPATSDMKRKRLAEVFGAVPDYVRYAPIDFDTQRLEDVLPPLGYDPKQRTFFILEGVTMYLPEDAARETLRFVGAHPPGSGIVFDFVYRAMIDMITRIDMANIPEAQKPFVQRFLDLTKNEPWIFGLPVGGEREFLREFGLDVREMFTVGGEDSAKRYLTRADGTQVGAQAIAEAMARMAARAREVANASPEVQQQMSPERMREQQRLSAYHLAEAFVAH